MLIFFFLLHRSCCPNKWLIKLDENNNLNFFFKFENEDPIWLKNPLNCVQSLGEEEKESLCRVPKVRKRKEWSSELGGESEGENFMPWMSWRKKKAKSENGLEDRIKWNENVIENEWNVDSKRWKRSKNEKMRLLWDSRSNKTSNSVVKFVRKWNIETKNRKKCSNFFHVENRKVGSTNRITGRRTGKVTAAGAGARGVKSIGRTRMSSLAGSSF